MPVKKPPDSKPGGFFMDPDESGQKRKRLSS